MSQEFTHADMSKVQALQQKRTLAFVNHFVTTNVQFLNNFMKNCEQKLMTFERKLEKVNASMVLLEARLSSIPELTHNIPQTPEVNDTPTTSEQVSAAPTESKGNLPNTELGQSNSQAKPEYDRFVKMVQVGVPVQAVKLKVSLEGLDPNILEEILQK